MKTYSENQNRYLNRSSIVTSNSKNWLVGILVSAWLISTIFAFWWFQFRNIQAFDINAVANQTVFFESGELGARLENLIKQAPPQSKNLKPISLVHFWNPDCPCSRFNEVHVKKIMSDYADKNIQFTIVVSGNNDEMREQRKLLAQKVFTGKAVKDIRSDWPMGKGPVSSPAVGVINSDGELVYFGPYSLGARCAPDQGQFVEKTLDRLNKQKALSKKQLNTLAVGCFCPWRTKS